MDSQSCELIFARGKRWEESGMTDPNNARTPFTQAFVIIATRIVSSRHDAGHWSFSGQSGWSSND